MGATIPDLECDLIMKGGITSGVVYPKAIVELSKHYRFKCIGGASAGAIAAGAAAAAEYGRVMGASGPDAGMDGIAKVPEQFKKGVLRFFQPAPELRRVFRVLTDMLKGLDDARTSSRPFSGLQGVAILARRYYPRWGIPMLLALTLATMVVLYQQWFGWGLIAVLALLAVLGGTVYLAIASMIGDVSGLSDHRFGLCPGKTVADAGQGPGLTTWLTELFNTLAGLDPAGEPLTFRHLHEARVELAAITTCLTLGRPYRLPLRTGIFWFDEAEFRQLFDKNVVDHMIKVAKAAGLDKREENDRTYWPFPGDRAKGGAKTGAELPVVVAVRMSLSFPFLLQAIPLYAVDHSIPRAPSSNEESSAESALEQGQLCPCWFSDGGISSNFPMHFFDSFLPGRPTFGISLGRYDPDKAKCDDPGDEDAASAPEAKSAVVDNKILKAEEARQRIARPVAPGEGHAPEFSSFKGVLGFAFRIIFTAKDWQDQLLSQLSGYRERVVTINLTEGEGGLNLTMPPERIENLLLFGKLAGENLVGSATEKGFDFDEHRWRRFLVTQDRVREMVQAIRSAWVGAPEPFGEFIERYGTSDERSYKGSKDDVRDVAKWFETLSDLGADWGEGPPTPQLPVPKPDTVMRIRPRE